MNFELKILPKFLDIWIEIKKTNRFELKEKIRKITQVGKKISVHEKKVKWKCACCFGSKFVL